MPEPAALALAALASGASGARFALLRVRKPTGFERPAITR